MYWLSQLIFEFFFLAVLVPKLDNETIKKVKKKQKYNELLSKLPNTVYKTVNPLRPL